jgi:NADH:ubiquinone oxidoreductase subunit 6 (subunit J)
MENLHILLCAFLLLSGLFVVLSGSPVESMISLIFMFCISGIILFIFNSEFLGVTFVIIYVGAIAVLFLFIIMMLNVKRTISSLSLKSVIISTVLLIFCLSLLYYIYQNEIESLLTKITLFKYSIDNRYLAKEINDVSFDYLGNINILGQSLFNYYSASFLLAGLVLLVALVGAVSLTLNFHTHKKTQVTFRQLSRTDAFLSHFKK